MKELWVPVSAAIAQQKNVETIANNVANANTPGFKKDQLAFKEYLTALEKGLQETELPNKEWAPEDFYRSYGAEHGMVKVDGSYTVHRQGTLSPTGNSLDLALSGPGFFEVLTPLGVRYTRKGIFSLSPQGELVTDQGLFVLSHSPPNAQGEVAPENRIIKLGKLGGERGNITITQKGEIFIDGVKRNQISLREFRDLHTLKKEGHSFFINRVPENLSLGSIKTTIHQGFVEQSNVNAVSEMSNLIKANRHFESIQKVIKTYNDMTGRSVNEISKF